MIIDNVGRFSYMRLRPLSRSAILVLLIHLLYGCSSTVTSSIDPQSLGLSKHQNLSEA